MNYVEHLNGLVRSRASAAGPLFIYGQNVCSGSCLGGMMRNIVSSGGLTIRNTPNTENGLMGLGLGIMLRGASAIYAMKQHDFMLLGIDQLANTTYAMRQRPAEGSFTILTIVVDSGYEGPQSSLNNLSDIASIIRLPCFTVTNCDDASAIINRHLVAPGARVIAASQRLFRTPVVAGPAFEPCDDDVSIARYIGGGDITLACFNFSLPQGLDLHGRLQQRGVQSDLFSVNAAHVVGYGPILASAKKTGRMIILDDSKSTNPVSQHLLLAARSVCEPDRTLYIKRPVNDELLRPNADEFEVDIDMVCRHFGLIGVA